MNKVLDELPHIRLKVVSGLFLPILWLTPVVLQGVPVAQNSLLNPVIAEVRVFSVESETPYNLAFISELPILSEPTEEIPILSELSETDNIYCSCVQTAKSLNDKIPLIDAKDFVPNITKKEVRVGDFILENFNGVAHVALIGDIQKSGYIIGGEGNYRECEYSEGRVVPYDSKNVRGFFRP